MYKNVTHFLYSETRLIYVGQEVGWGLHTEGRRSKRKWGQESTRVEMSRVVCTYGNVLMKHIVVMVTKREVLLNHKNPSLFGKYARDCARGRTRGKDPR